jgi:hypothetical protein
MNPLSKKGEETTRAVELTPPQIRALLAAEPFRGTDDFAWVEGRDKLLNTLASASEESDRG